MLCIDQPWLRYYEDINVKKNIKKTTVSLNKFDNKNVCITYYILTKKTILSSQKNKQQKLLFFF